MKLLYAEDEQQLSMAVTEILKMEHYNVDSVYDGTSAWEHLQKNSYDIVLLDIMMPGMSGIQVVEKMREHNIFTPVVLLTAKNETDDRIAGLTCGADDYLGKPFSMGELIARLNVLLRRSTQYKPGLLSVGNISLNCETSELKSDLGSLRLSSKETELLALFLKNTNRVFTTEELLQEFWSEQSDQNSLILYISYLKNKLQQLNSNHNIKSEQDGYLLCAL